VHEVIDRALAQFDVTSECRTYYNAHKILSRNHRHATITWAHSQ
jgi:hypothetical protein